MLPYIEQYISKSVPEHDVVNRAVVDAMKMIIGNNSARETEPILDVVFIINILF